MTDEVKWPDRVALRDTKVFADEGQRIFSTATGYGYDRNDYIRVDIVNDLREDNSILKDELAELRSEYDELIEDYNALFAQRSKQKEPDTSDEAVETLDRLVKLVLIAFPSLEDLPPIKEALRVVESRKK